MTCILNYKTKNYNIGICYFSAKHASLWSKSKNRLTRNQDIVSECSDMSTSGLLFQRIRTIKIEVCWSSTQWTSSSSHKNVTSSRHDIVGKFSHLVLNNNYSLTHSSSEYIGSMYFLKCNFKPFLTKLLKTFFYGFVTTCISIKQYLFNSLFQVLKGVGLGYGG
jgi:hypothetical protein